MHIIFPEKDFTGKVLHRIFRRLSQDFHTDFVLHIYFMYFIHTYIYTNHIYMYNIYICNIKSIYIYIYMQDMYIFTNKNNFQGKHLKLINIFN